MPVQAVLHIRVDGGFRQEHLGTGERLAKEKADLWQNIEKINDFCLSLQRERKRFPPAEMKE